jgi:hypothetical protein
MGGTRRSFWRPGWYPKFSNHAQSCPSQDQRIPSPTSFFHTLSKGLQRYPPMSKGVQRSPTLSKGVQRSPKVSNPTQSCPSLSKGLQPCLALFQSSPKFSNPDQHSPSPVQKSPTMSSVVKALCKVLQPCPPALSRICPKVFNTVHRYSEYVQRYSIQPSVVPDPVQRSPTLISVVPARTKCLQPCLALFQPGPKFSNPNQHCPSSVQTTPKVSNPV